MLKAVILLICLACSRSFTSTFRNAKKSSLYAYDPKEAAKEEQMKIQQEILARRKNKSGMKKYFDSVEDRRKETQKIVSQNNWREEKNDVDPITKWKDSLEKGTVKKIGYEPEPSKTDSLFGLNIIVPINPIGIGKYDDGERFDLRLPYAERGYEDPDADVLGKLGQGFSNLFNFGKKKNDENKDPKVNSKAPKKK
eukprot:gene6194-12548_t